MNKFPTLTAWTIFTDFLIPVAIGHGVGILILPEIFMWSDLNDTRFTLVPEHFYEDRINQAAFISLLGQILLFISLWLNKDIQILCIKVVGLLLLYIGFAYLTVELNKEHSGTDFTIFLSLPFLILSIILLVKQIKEYKKVKDVDKV